MFDRKSVESTINNYSEIIQEYEILSDIFEDNKYTIELRIFFKDESRLENRDVFLFMDDLIKRRYKFQ
ncbi:MAG: hypothetical protein KDK36_01410 [Leptospiraceae bacterium]|nr:hypothetical protein [Leptospiraceae bacterium]